MTQDDAHIYCTVDQMQGELISLLQFVLDLLADFGLTDFYLELSTRDPGEVGRLRRRLGASHRGTAQSSGDSGLELKLDPGGRPSTRRRSRFKPTMRSVGVGSCPPSKST